MKKEGNNPNLIVLDKDEQKLVFGLIVGIPVEVTLTENFGLYTALTYHQKGIKVEQSYPFFDSYTELEGITKLNYLELPVQCKYYITNKTLSAYVALGPSFGYLINGRFKIDSQTINENDEISYINSDEKIKSKDLKDSGIKRLDISLVLGGGISYKVGIGDIFLNINYSHGFTNILDESVTEVYEGVTQKNRGVNITCGYLIALSN